MVVIVVVVVAVVADASPSSSSSSASSSSSSSSSSPSSSSAIAQHLTHLHNELCCHHYKHEHSNHDGNRNYCRSNFQSLSPHSHYRIHHHHLGATTANKDIAIAPNQSTSMIIIVVIINIITLEFPPLPAPCPPAPLPYAPPILLPSQPSSSS